MHSLHPNLADPKLNLMDMVSIILLTLPSPWSYDMDETAKAILKECFVQILETL